MAYENKLALFALHFKMKPCTKINVISPSSVGKKNDTLFNAGRGLSTLHLTGLKPEIKNKRVLD